MGTFQIVITPRADKYSFVPVKIQHPPYLPANMRPVTLEYPGALTRCPSMWHEMFKR